MNEPWWQWYISTDATWESENAKIKTQPAWKRCTHVNKFQSKTTKNISIINHNDYQSQHHQMPSVPTNWISIIAQYEIPKNILGIEFVFRDRNMKKTCWNLWCVFMLWAWKTHSVQELPVIYLNGLNFDAFSYCNLENSLSDKNFCNLSQRFAPCDNW